MFRTLIRIFLLAAVAVLTVQGPVEARGKTVPARPLPIDVKHLVVLTKTSIIAVNQANRTGNYSVLQALAAPAFREKNSAKDLEKIFAKLRTSNLDLSPIVIYNPEFTNSPQITPQGMLRLTGYFPTRPLQVNFDLLFQPVGGEWRLYGISLNPAQRAAPVSQLR